MTPTPGSVLVSGLLVVLCGYAAWCDFRTGKIPNRLTYSGIVAGLLIAAIVPDELVTSRFLGTLLGFASLYIFWQWRMIGGGDVKLAMMVGAFKGPVFVLYFLLYVFSLCVVVILLVAVYRTGIKGFAIYVWKNLLGLFAYRLRPSPIPALEGLKIPFAVAALIAVCMCLVLEWRGLLFSPLG